MTDAVVSQVTIETLRTDADIDARVAQVTVEVLRHESSLDARVAQLVVEVLRPNATEGEPSGVVPVPILLF